jgi:hypothetical protein
MSGNRFFVRRLQWRYAKHSTDVATAGTAEYRCLTKYRRSD